MKVAKGKLKARMLEYFREVERTGEPLVVTDNGREVLEVRPLKEAKDEVSAKKHLNEIRLMLFGEEVLMPENLNEDLLAPEWPMKDESDDDWWCNPTEKNNPPE